MAYLPTNDVLQNGTLALLNQTVVLTLNNQSGATIDISGTWVGTITFQGTVNTVTPLYGNINAVAASTPTPATTTTVNGLYRLTPGSLGAIQVIMTSFTSGSATISMRAGGVGGTFANQILPTNIMAALPTGANTIGNVNVIGTVPVSLATAPTTPVTGTFFQATQPVSLATNTPVIATGTNTIGTVNTTPTLPTTTNATLSSAATTNATSVKASAGTIYSITASNIGAAAAFLKIYNLSTAPTVGTSVPELTVPIAASGQIHIPFPQGFRNATGISFAITNLVADSDVTAIAAAQVKVMIAYI